MNTQSTGSSQYQSVPGAEKPISVTVQDACRITGIGLTTMYGLIGKGDVETFTIGRRRLVKYSSLESLAR